ncbi:YdcF family protein [Pacificimonas sp. ICDLI1SI03]
MNYALWGLFGPVSWPFWLSTAALLFLARGQHFLAKTSLAAAATLFLLFGLLPTGEVLVRLLEDRFEQPAFLPQVDRILVLAGGEDSFASARTGQVEFGVHGDRSVAAGLLAKRHPSAKLYIAGYGRMGKLPTSDTRISARYWAESGIAAERIIEVEGTSDSCANLSGYAAAAPSGPVVLVTSAFHMPRAMACARSAGVNAIPYPVDVQVGSQIQWRPQIERNLSLLDLALHEWIGLVWYRVHGRIA